MIRKVFVVFAFISVAFGSPVSEEFLDRNGRIVGGSNAPLGRFPWMVTLRRAAEGTHFCGGSIISNRWIMTAAHCTIDRTPSMVRAIVGTVLRSGQGGVNHAISRIVNHPNFIMDGNPGHDISVLQTSATIVFNTNVRDIQLGSSFIGSGVTATVIGFGRLESGGAVPTQLQQLNVRTITSAQCSRPEIILCTQMPVGFGICNGDSGSPMFTGGMQIGIASSGRGGVCGNGLPDSYTRISSFRTWVLNTIR